MIQQLHITSPSGPIDEPLQKYVNKKIGRLDRLIPRRFRSGLSAVVTMQESKTTNGAAASCQVSLRIGSHKLTVSETTINMYAAVDIAEMKLRQQIIKYKQTHAGSTLRQRLRLGSRSADIYRAAKTAKIDE